MPEHVRRSVDDKSGFHSKSHHQANRRRKLDSERFHKCYRLPSQETAEAWPTMQISMQISIRLERRFLEVTENNGAGDRDRTGDIQLGKLAFYR